MIIVLLFALSAGSQAQTTAERLMTDADYRAFLLQVETALPKWETALKNIDPEKDPRISFSLSKSIVDERDAGLMEVGNIRLSVVNQRVKHTVLGEVALSGFIRSLYDVMGDEVHLEDAAGLTLSSLEKYAPELSALSIRIGNDVFARVELLEQGTAKAGATTSVQPAKALSDAPSNERLKRFEDGDRPIEGDGYIIVDGIWKPESGDPRKALIFKEQIRISCDKSENVCRELSVTLAPAGGMVLIMGPQEKEWKITSWDAHGLLASYGPDRSATGVSDRCNSHVLTITLASGAVSTSDIPTHEKGCETFTETSSYRLVRGQYFVDTTPENDAKKPSK
jgi:hypothetical protein